MSIPTVATRDANLGHLLDELLAMDESGAHASPLVNEIKSVLTNFAGAPTALERATALWAWHRAYQAEHPEKSRGGARRGAQYRDAIKRQTLPFEEMAAKEVGLASRSIRSDVALAEALGPVAIRHLWSSPIADNAAALKRVAPFVRVSESDTDDADRARRVLGRLGDLWADNPRLPLGKALEALQITKSIDSREHHFRVANDALARGGAPVQRRIIRQWASVFMRLLAEEGLL